MKGYIVIGYFNSPKSLYDKWVPEGCRKGILTNDLPGTIFPTPETAKSAIERTLKYAKERNIDSEIWTKMKIYQIKTP